MKNSKFEINILPQINDITSNSIDEIINSIKANYNLLRKDAHILLNASIDKNLSKPTIYYNLIFFIEISLKYYLIVVSELNIEDVEKIGHDIYRLIEVSKQYNKMFEKLKFLLNRIKNGNNKIDLSKYYNYKYNKEIGIIPLIFDLKINNNEKIIVEEVIEWLDLHI